MSIWALFILAVGLSMDAFAVAVCKGLSICNLRLKDAAIVGLYFGIFQAGMPLIGYFLGSRFSDMITSMDHWIAFILLLAIGGNMLRESFKKEDICEDCNASLHMRDMLVLAVATSIDALAVGITLAFLQVDILPAVSFIGVITFLLSMLGVKIGNVFGRKFKAAAERFGGIVLMLIGLNILLEHLGVIG